MSNKVRVRFAPSPTGYLHIGGVRSALFNYLWARHNDGAFVLRIEDTDRERLVSGAVEQIARSLKSLGISPDEGPFTGGEYGPYQQSDRLDIYLSYAQTLHDAGALYPCWCSATRLDGLRAEARAAGVAFKYDRFCLANPRSLEEPHVLRFLIPSEPSVVSWDDAVRGRLQFNTSELDDFVAIKSDGYPTYHFANVVDDHLMEISHVLRADEWIPSTPKHLLLFKAFGWAPPIYAHLPAVQGPDGRKKLSKRDGAKSVEEFVSEGFLPEAILSYLASLGWNDGTTQEVFTREALIAKFTLERIQKSPAQFQLDRLLWINGKLIRETKPHDLLPRLESFWPPSASNATNVDRIGVLTLVQDRLKTLGELSELTDFFFEDPQLSSEALTSSYNADQVKTHLTAFSETLAGLRSWDEPSLESTIRDYVESAGLKTGQAFGLLRIVITGRTAAPGLFETMAVLGQETTLRRLRSALSLVS